MIPSAITNTAVQKGTRGRRLGRKGSKCKTGHKTKPVLCVSINTVLPSEPQLCQLTSPKQHNNSLEQAAVTSSPPLLFHNQSASNSKSSLSSGITEAEQWAVESLGLQTRSKCSFLPTYKINTIYESHY